MHLVCSLLKEGPETQKKIEIATEFAEDPLPHPQATEKSLPEKLLLAPLRWQSPALSFVAVSCLLCQVNPHHTNHEGTSALPNPLMLGEPKEKQAIRSCNCNRGIVLRLSLLTSYFAGT